MRYLCFSQLIRSARYFCIIACIATAPATLAQEPIAAGLHDLVVYDPGAHERGLPSPQFVDVGNGLKVDIPPAVHIHRYYYSGDKEIQGPIINGGPTVVVANHPKTGERMYIDVVLPAGAPRIAYNKHGITYIYPSKRVAVTFQHFSLNPNKSVVKIHHGQGLGRSIQQAHEHLSEHLHESLADSTLAQSGKETLGETGDFMHGMKVAIGDLSAKGLDGIKTLSNMVPGVAYLKSLAEQEPERDYANSIRAASLANERAETTFVPTNR